MNLSSLAGVLRSPGTLRIYVLGLKQSSIKDGFTDDMAVESRQFKYVNPLSD